MEEHLRASLKNVLASSGARSSFNNIVRLGSLTYASNFWEGMIWSGVIDIHVPKRLTDSGSGGKSS